MPRVLKVIVTIEGFADESGLIGRADYTAKAETVLADGEQATEQMMASMSESAALRAVQLVQTHMIDTRSKRFVEGLEPVKSDTSRTH